MSSFEPRVDLERETVPDLWVEWLIAGELPPAQAEALRARLEREHDPRLERFGAENADFFQAHPAGPFVARVRAAAEAEASTRDGGAAWLWVALPVAALLLLGAWAWWGQLRAGEELPDPGVQGPVAMAEGGDEEGVRIKGLRASLRLHLETAGGELRQLSDGERVQSGARIQVAYVAAGSEHGVIVSIDGRGAATLHHPQSPAGDSALRDEGEIPLPFSYELDDAPKFERFFFITSPSPLDVQAVVDAAEALAAQSDAATGELELEAVAPSSTSFSFILTK